MGLCGALLTFLVLVLIFLIPQCPQLSPSIPQELALVYLVESLCLIYSHYGVLAYKPLRMCLGTALRFGRSILCQ